MVPQSEETKVEESEVISKDIWPVMSELGIERRSPAYPQPLEGIGLIVLTFKSTQLLEFHIGNALNKVVSKELQEFITEIIQQVFWKN